MTLLTWLAIALCLTQSAILSGLNLALFSVGKLELEVTARNGDRAAAVLLRLRQDANFALVTILWGNVAVNVLLALLSGSILSGVGAFLFSTVIITLGAEIAPQAYFSRHAVRVGARLAPLLRLYQFVLWPVARPTAWVLDRWLGGEPIRYLEERDLRRLIQLHMEAAASDIARVEGQGAANFLDLDDVRLADEGEPLDPRSIVQLDFAGDRPAFPPIAATPDDPFLRAVAASGKRWVVLIDGSGSPKRVLEADAFLRAALFQPAAFDPQRHCHRPLVIADPATRLGDVLPAFRIRSDAAGQDIPEGDVVLLWTARPRIVTGTDILGRLLRGIARPAG